MALPKLFKSNNFFFCFFIYFSLALFSSFRSPFSFFQFFKRFFAFLSFIFFSSTLSLAPFHLLFACYLPIFASSYPHSHSSPSANDSNESKHLINKTLTIQNGYKAQIQTTSRKKNNFLSIEIAVKKTYFIHIENE